MFQSHQFARGRVTRPLVTVVPGCRLGGLKSDLLRACEARLRVREAGLSQSLLEPAAVRNMLMAELMKNQ